MSEGRGLIGAREVANLLSCSVRNVYRLVEAERMPKPVRIGRMTRWQRAEIERWIAEGCPDACAGERP